MEILISGGAGFIGSSIASASMDAGHIPVILDDMSTGAESFVDNRVFYRGDIADGKLIDIPRTSTHRGRRALCGKHRDTRVGR